MRPARLVVLLALLALMVTPILTQPSWAAAAGQQGADQEEQMEGDIRSLDPETRTIDILGLYGFSGTTVQVTDHTKFVSAPGAREVKGFEQLEPRDRIRASYRREGNRNVAQKIDVLATPGQAPAASPQGPEAVPSGGAPPDTGAVHKIEGKVSKVDAANKTVSLETRPGLGATMLYITDQTSFEGPGVNSLASLRQGEDVRASYVERDGRNVAEKIESAAVAPQTGPEQKEGETPQGR